MSKKSEWLITKDSAINMATVQFFEVKENTIEFFFALTSLTVSYDSPEIAKKQYTYLKYRFKMS